MSNSFPIILVHGYSGWGRDELKGFKYWGGDRGDIQEQLKKQGYTVFTATVGPFSSNWDRACELYAQIKGGRVDYGEVHSRAHGHARHGRTFTGLYPQWGQLGVNGKVNKVHLIGHSMGGQTIRMLAQLLAKGSIGSPTVEATTTHPLFGGGKDWVHSITTIATPNHGSVLADGVALIGDLVKTAIVGFFSTLGALEHSLDDIYDVKLDQWGISLKAPGETLAQYLNRVLTSPIFKPGFKDIALWSLTTEGAKQENTWVETLPSVYYFSYATSDTHASRDFRLRKVHRPNKSTMALPLQPLASFMGGRYTPNHGFPEAWQENDGHVNTASMLKDASGSYVEFTGVARRGVWNGLPVLKSMDHLAVVGLSRDCSVFETLYSVHAKRLSELPVECTAVALETSHDDKGELLVKKLRGETAIEDEDSMGVARCFPPWYNRIAPTASRVGGSVRPTNCK